MNEYGYGLWAAVVIDSAVFILFALSVFHPATKRDWKAMSAFSAFILALFAEMYGFPLTIYLLTGWLGSRFPGLSLTHNGGHLWSDLIGWQGDPHLSPFHIVSYVLIGGGFALIAYAWRRLWTAVRDHELATHGAYAWMRHPQYAGFILIMVGFLLQWPTLPTLVMFPILVVIYRRLAISEEAEMHAEFGVRWERYAGQVPRFVPRARGPHRRPRGAEPPETSASRLRSSPHQRPVVRADALRPTEPRPSNV
jgi:protein-S-isoprenylcysteine O-methyltransferase Ste14